MGISIKDQGRIMGKREVVRMQMEKKFGPQPEEVLARLETLSIERLEEISLAILDAKSLDELGLSA